MHAPAHLCAGARFKASRPQNFARIESAHTTSLMELVRNAQKTIVHSCLHHVLLIQKHAYGVRNLLDKDCKP